MPTRSSIFDENPSIDGPDYVALVIEWDELADDLEKNLRSEPSSLLAEPKPAGFSRTVDAADAGLVYLADVYVHPAHRDRELRVELVRFTVDEGPYAERRWVLHTKDAHDLYARFGFAAGERLLERPAPPG